MSGWVSPRAQVASAARLTEGSRRADRGARKGSDKRLSRAFRGRRLADRRRAGAHRLPRVYDGSVRGQLQTPQAAAQRGKFIVTEKNMAQIRADEITSILRSGDRIREGDRRLRGRLGDFGGRRHRQNSRSGKVMAGELIEFPHDVAGIP